MCSVNRMQQQDLEDTNRRVAKLSGDIDKLASMGSERARDVEQQLVVARWQLAERTQQLLALHRALKGLQTAPAAPRLASPSENDDPSSANSLAVCASLRSTLGLDLDVALEELENAASRVQPFSVEAVLAAAGRGDSAAFDRIIQPSTGSESAAAASGMDHDSAQGLALVMGQALCHAAASGHVSLVTRCLSLGADASVIANHNGYGQTAFLLAAAGGHEAVLKLLLSKGSASGGGSGASVDETDAYRRTALHLAAAGNHAGVTKLLLFNGADPAALDCNGLSPVAVAEGTEDLLSPPSAADKGLGAHYRTGELPTNRRAPAVLKVLSDANVRFWNASVRANRAYQDRQFGRAIAAYSDALGLATGGARPGQPPQQRMAASPRDLATLFYNRARSHYRIGAHCAAIDDCTTALEHDPTYRNALAQVGLRSVPGAL